MSQAILPARMEPAVAFGSDLAAYGSAWCLLSRAYATLPTVASHLSDRDCTMVGPPRCAILLCAAAVISLGFNPPAHKVY